MTPIAFSYSSEAISVTGLGPVKIRFLVLTELIVVVAPAVAAVRSASPVAAPLGKPQGLRIVALCPFRTCPDPTRESEGTLAQVQAPEQGGAHEREHCHQFDEERDLTEDGMLCQASPAARRSFACLALCAVSAAMARLGSPASASTWASWCPRSCSPSARRGSLPG